MSLQGIEVPKAAGLKNRPLRQLDLFQKGSQEWISDRIHDHGSPAIPAGSTPERLLDKSSATLWKTPGGPSPHYHLDPVQTGSTPGAERFVVTWCSKKHAKRKRDGRSITICNEGTGRFAHWKKEREGIAFDGRIPSRPFLLERVDGQVRVFRCKSIRCPKCRKQILHRDFVRINEALQKHGQWIYSVLTFDTKSWISGRESAWKNGWRTLQRFRQRLERHIGEQIRYIAVMEQHASGWPHVNFLFTWDSIDKLDNHQANALAADLKKWMKRTAPAVGLGWSIEAGRLESREKIANYLSSVAAGSDGKAPEDDKLRADRERFVNEVNASQGKEYQIPTQAPIGIRRTRASRGLLPALWRGNGDSAGGLYLPSPKKGEDQRGEPGTRGGVNSPRRAAKRGPEAPVPDAKRRASPSSRRAHAPSSADIGQVTAAKRGSSRLLTRYSNISSTSYRHEVRVFEAIATISGGIPPSLSS